MRSASGFCKPAVDMIVKRLIAAAVLAVVLAGLGPLLASCGGVTESGVSGYVADHWPHWAGGMPADAPPRPGAPGYDEFIAHGQADRSTTNADRTGHETCHGRSGTAGFPIGASAGAPETRPANNPAAEDTSAVKGGLY